MTNIFSTLQLQSARNIWHRGVKSARRLVGLLVRASPFVSGGSSLGWVKASFVFSKFAVGMIKHSGHKGLALYLKASNVCLMQMLGAQTKINPRKVGCAVSLSNSGIPRFIPGSHRLRIKQGDIGVIRLWIGFMTLYRVLNYRGKLSFDSVTRPGVILDHNLLLYWKMFCKEFISMLVVVGARCFGLEAFENMSPDAQKEVKSSDMWYTRRGYPLPEDFWYKTMRLLEYGTNNPMRRLVLFPLMKSGPNSKEGSISVSNIIDDIQSWITREGLFIYLLKMVVITKTYNLIDHPAWGIARTKINIDMMNDKFGTYGPEGKVKSVRDIKPIGNLGRLSVVEEPGKMRVVAMVDCLTQWILYPLHRFIFDEILRVIPQDGTFDHIQPVKKLIKVMKERNLRWVASFDLSAATDRIPVVLQELLLASLCSVEFASCWRSLLTKRDYRLPSSWIKTYGGKKCGMKSIRYEVGQPMGAYSSWAMLALVHHAIIQFAAARAGKKGWFDLYAVLGDDVVIGCRDVATEYQLFMEQVGVNIGFNKSIISKNGSLEFAKRFFHKGVEVTPLPLVGIACSWLGVSAVPEVVKASEARLGKRPSLYSISKLVGAGFKAASSIYNINIRKLPRNLRSIVLLLRQPNGVDGLSDYWTWLRLRSYATTTKVRDSWYGSTSAMLLSLLRNRDPSALMKRLDAAYDAFILSDVKKLGVRDLDEWWRVSIRNPYRDPIAKGINDWKKRRESLLDSEEKVDEKQLSHMLDEFVSFENFIARIPIKVKVSRDAKSTIVARPGRVAKMVKFWRKANKLQVHS